jgi:hypothetical protein
VSNYIYELDLAHLRISYILPEKVTCKCVNTSLYNDSPGDRSNLTMSYSCILEENGKFDKVITAKSLPELVEECRKWAIRYTHSPVDKSPHDGTDSLIEA